MKNEIVNNIINLLEEGGFDVKIREYFTNCFDFDIETGDENFETSFRVAYDKSYPSSFIDEIKDEIIALTASIIRDGNDEDEDLIDALEEVTEYLDKVEKEVEKEHIFENYSNKFYGIPLSQEDKDMGYISYATLAKTFNSVLANWVTKFFHEENFDVLSGDIDNEIFQWFIIDNVGAEILPRETNELVVHVDTSDGDFYVWGVDHIGTSWGYVPTDIKIVDKTVNK